MVFHRRLRKDTRIELPLQSIAGAARLEKFLADGAVIVEAELKRWRYSQPTVLHPERYLAADGLPPLYFAGDAFREARVEGAFLSGTAAGEALAKVLA